MKLIFGIAFILVAFMGKSQDLYRLKYNAETNRVFYQGVIENTLLKQAELYTKGLGWCQQAGKVTKSTDPANSNIIAEATFSTIGRKTSASKAYHYVFTAEIKLEFKDGKTRYSFDNFKKKTSPGSPGSTLEYFIENYQPTILSDKTRDSQAKMLDDIEIAIESQVMELITQLKDTFGVESSSDW